MCVQGNLLTIFSLFGGIELQRVADQIVEIFRLAAKKRNIASKIADIVGELRELVENETKNLVMQKLGNREIEEPIEIRIEVPKDNPRALVVIENKYEGIGRWNFDFLVSPRGDYLENADDIDVSLSLIKAYMAVLEHKDDILRELEKYRDKIRTEIERLKEAHEKAKKIASKVLVARKI